MLSYSCLIRRSSYSLNDSREQYEELTSQGILDFIESVSPLSVHVYFRSDDTVVLVVVEHGSALADIEGGKYYERPSI